MMKGKIYGCQRRGYVRGNNYRDTSGVYGSLEIREKQFSEPLWKQKTGTLKTIAGTGYWSGWGWDRPAFDYGVAEIYARAIMEMYDWGRRNRRR